jgi:hypothetical protein
MTQQKLKLKQPLQKSRPWENKIYISELERKVMLLEMLLIETKNKHAEFLRERGL